MCARRPGECDAGDSMSVHADILASGTSRAGTTKGAPMTDPSYTAFLLIIDRSGSMSTIRDDVIEVQCSLASPEDVVISLGCRAHRRQPRIRRGQFPHLRRQPVCSGRNGFFFRPVRHERSLDEQDGVHRCGA